LLLEKILKDKEKRESAMRRDEKAREEKAATLVQKSP
jgi:hypothetical protein